MPQSVYPWTTSWYRNIQLVAGFADAAALMCGITHDQHKLMMSRRAMRIEASPLQDALIEHAANLGDILEWVQDGVKRHNACERVPDTFLLTHVDFAEHRSAWTKHVTESKQELSGLKRDLEALLNELNDKRKKFEVEDTGGYSSYSDYSEDETDSEEEDDGFEDEEEEDEDEDEDDQVRASERRRVPVEDREKRRNRNKG